MRGLGILITLLIPIAFTLGLWCGGTIHKERQTAPALEKLSVCESRGRSTRAMMYLLISSVDAGHTDVKNTITAARLAVQEETE